MTNRIKALREAGPMTQAELGDLIGVSWQTISRIENSHTRIMPKHERTLSDVFGVSVEELYVANEPRRISLEQEYEEETAAAAETFRSYSRENYRPRVPGAIPEIDVELGAGEGRVGEVLTLPLGNESYSGHRVVDEWLLPESYYDRVLEAHSGNTLVMPVVGDSMMPTYNPGDRVVIDLTQDSLTTDTVYAISDGFSPPQIKRLQRVMFSQPTEVQIISDNANHTPQTVPLGALKIIGRIIGVMAKR